MKLPEIREHWKNPDQEPEAAVALWESQADDPTYHIMPTFEDNAFLQLLVREGMAEPSFDVLDLGCGAGIYPVALSKKVHRAVGIDISPKMLEHGNALLKKEQISNVEFMLTDWNTVSLENEGLKERFDLVYTHTSPAVSDAASLEKMIAASRRFCAVCNPIKMVEPVLEEIRRRTGIEEEEEHCGSGMIYMLDMLLQMGYRPKLEYESQVWPMSQNFEKACAYYTGRISMGQQLPQETIETVKDYLTSILKDGLINDRIDATVTTVYWEK